MGSQSNGHLCDWPLGTNMSSLMAVPEEHPRGKDWEGILHKRVPHESCNLGTGNRVNWSVSDPWFVPWLSQNNHKHDRTQRKNSVCVRTKHKLGGVQLFDRVHFLDNCRSTLRPVQYHDNVFSGVQFLLEDYGNGLGRSMGIQGCHASSGRSRNKDSSQYLPMTSQVRRMKCRWQHHTYLITGTIWCVVIQIDRDYRMRTI